MRWQGVLFALLLASAAEAGDGGTSRLDGTWVGKTEAGSEVVWHVDGARLRMDGRPADLEVRSDTLIVRFDAPPDAAPDDARETAVYRFLASNGVQTPARMFVFGFDLGKNGIHLERQEAATSPPAEDAAPTPPAPTGTGGSASSSTAPGTSLRRGN